MTMKLEGSCHCGAVRFGVRSHTPQPYMRCYCSICRKTAGGGGYAINIMGDAETLTVEGGENITVYQAQIDGEISPALRHFCKRCGSALYVSDPRWPDLMHPFASAIDTPLPVPNEVIHIMLDFKAPWVAEQKNRQDSLFDGYPDQSIEDWHKTQGMYLE